MSFTVPELFEKSIGSQWLYFQQCEGALSPSAWPVKETQSHAESWSHKAVH
jgi:hypothetical protein